MAKKAVATFDAKAGAKHMVKVIRMEKSPKTGAYKSFIYKSFVNKLIVAEN